MLVMKFVRFVSISNSTDKVLRFSYKDLGPLARRVIPWNYIQVDFEGWSQSEMILQVEPVERKGTLSFEL